MWNKQDNDSMKAYIDLDAGLSRVRGNQSLYRRMLRLFCASEEFDALETALTEQNLTRAAELAHAIKGMTGNLALDRLFALSGSLTDQFRHGIQDQATIDEYRRVLTQTRMYAERLAEDPNG